MLKHRPQGLQIGFPNSMISFSQARGQYKVIKFGVYLLVTWGKLKIFFAISALTPSVKPLGVISAFAPIEMLELSSTLALTP
jgi:hypothetical protein